MQIVNKITGRIGALALLAGAALGQNIVVPKVRTALDPGPGASAPAPSSAVISNPTAPASDPQTPQVFTEQIIRTPILQLCDIRGMQENFLYGVGVVVGLAGTGDGGVASRQALASFLTQSGMNRKLGDVSAGNIALVALRATLPPFAHVGQKVDVSVESLGDAKSLFGGALLPAPLLSGDQQVYAWAQGALNVAGIRAEGDNARVVRNHPTAGEIPDGATVVRPVVSTFLSKSGAIHLDLKLSSFKVATAIQDAINETFPSEANLEPVATAIDPGTVLVRIPPDLRELHDKVKFTSIIESLKVEPESSQVVVADKKSGTIVIGRGVQVSAAAIQIGGFNLTIANTDTASQPAPLSSTGTTTVTTTTDAELTYDPRRNMEMIHGAANLEDVVRALNALNVRSHDLIEVLVALKKANALHAKLIIK